MSSIGIDAINTNSVEAITSQALRYPYPRPNKSFIFKNGEIHDLPTDFSIDDPLTPVLAIGSNMSPEQLRRKYKYPVTIPVLSVTVQNVDVVYGALLARYGSVAATITASWGTQINLAVNFLDQVSLKRMHETESSYSLCKLRQDLAPIKWHDNVTVKSDVLCYVASNGPLVLAGTLMSLESIPALRRRFRSISQEQAQKAVAEATGYDESVTDFVLNNVRDEQRRKSIVSRMERRKGFDDCFVFVTDLNGVTSGTSITKYTALNGETQVM